ncbi:hypothetical protein BDF14DRAFT_753555 [Spinellus fusiger]|nr:hypothetical protein BDF14DRAFT_753555 [Spinellus fusiger]
MSATLQVMEKDSHAQLEMIKSAYDNNVQLRTRLDLHVTVQPTLEPSVLFSRNSQRNLARLFARTDYIIDMPTSMIPATDLHKTFEINRDIFEEVLDVGDVLVVPTFGFHQSNVDSYTIPHHKTRLLELVDSKQMSMIDKHSEPNHGPTNATLWRDAQTLYTVENYEFHYEPIVLESKRVQPWCAERFIDNRYACYFASYLSGTQFRVLPDDFVVQLPQVKSNELSDFDRVIEDRLYAKFFWEKCVHHARQLDALNLWNTPKSLHLHSQCSRVIQNWGKGLIGKI